VIEAIYRLGKELLKEEQKPWFYEKPQADRLLILNFEGGRLSGIEERKDIGNLWGKLLYKRVRASRRCNVSIPTFFLNLKEPEKSISCLRSIAGWLRKHGYELPVEVEQEELLSALKEKLKEIKSSEKVLLTIKVDGRLPGEIPELVEAYKKALKADLGFGDAKIGICSLCGKKTKVSGKKSPFAFYTIDKPGYIPGFSKELHHRGFPLCFDCFRALEKAKAFLEEKRFSLASGAPKYSIIPSLTVTGEGSLEIAEYLEVDRLKERVGLSEEQRMKLADAEEDILDYLKELQDTLTLHFLFIQKNQSQELIKLHVQDVFPSRLKELFKIKEAVVRLVPLKRDFTFSTVSRFFYDRNAGRKEVKKEFLEIVDRVFRGAPVSETRLISSLLEGVREDYYRELSGEGGNSGERAREALATFLFVKEATENHLEEAMKEPKNLKELVDSLPFFNPHNPEEKGLFLLGALTQRLLEEQYKARKSKPFLKKLSAFRLNQRGFEKLVAEVIEKLESYDAFGASERKIHEAMSSYFAQARPRWETPQERMNFVFISGMGLKQKVYGALSKEFENLKEGGSHD